MRGEGRDGARKVSEPPDDRSASLVATSESSETHASPGRVSSEGPCRAPFCSETLRRLRRGRVQAPHGGVHASAVEPTWARCDDRSGRPRRTAARVRVLRSCNSSRPHPSQTACNSTVGSKRSPPSSPTRRVFAPPSLVILDLGAYSPGMASRDCSFLRHALVGRFTRHCWVMRDAGKTPHRARFGVRCSDAEASRCGAHE